MSIIERIKRLAMINATTAKEEQKTAKTEYDYFYEKGKAEALENLLDYIEHLESLA